MILDTIASIAFALFAGIVGLFPNANPVTISAINSNLSGFKTLLQAGNWLFPVQTFTSFLMIILGIEFVINSVKLLMWVLENITLGIFKRA